MFPHMFGRPRNSTQPAHQRRTRRRFCLLEGLEERALLAGSPTVFMVSNTSDNPALVGSLPWAVKKADANSNPAGSSIDFNKHFFKATTPRTITLSSTLVLSEMKGPEVIDGPGTGAVTVSGNNSVEVFSVDTGVTATLSGLTISGGNAGAAGAGGGVANYGTLTLTNSTVEHSSAFLGGGIHNDGTLNVTGSIIEDNTASGSGGGISNYGTLTMSGSTVDSNGAFNDGGISNGGATIAATLTLTDSTIESNTATEDGGGIGNVGALTVFECTVADNSAVLGAGILSDQGSMYISGSTISANHGADYGSGIAVAQSTLIVTNSTVAGNAAAVSGAGIENFNGGHLLAVNCTIAYNTVNSTAGSGAGLYVDAGATTTLENTIVAYNTQPYVLSVIHGITTTIRGESEIGLAAGAADVNGQYDLIGGGGLFGLNGTGGSGGLTNGSDGNQVGANADLGTLASNGGPTDTISLLAASPAINAGDNALVHQVVSIMPVHLIFLTTDQRGTGFVRIYGGTVDIGAFEVQPA